MKNFIKGIFGKKVNVEILSASELVEKLKWAEVEVSDTKDALTGLKYRLEHGVLVMEDIAADAQEIIARHQEILSKATNRRSEFAGQVSQVEVALTTVDNIYSEGEKN
jgi:hypothetical protein